MNYGVAPLPGNFAGEFELESYNQLSDISFLNQLSNPEELKSLYLGVNNINSNLTPFSHFINLEELDLGMYDFSKEITKTRGNKLYGSLEPLKSLTKLRILDISNTDIDSGLEYLPDSLEELYCSTRERSNSRVK